MSGLPPVVRRFWSPIVTVLLRNWPHSELDAVGRTIVGRLPTRLDDAADLGRARAASEG